VRVQKGETLLVPAAIEHFFLKPNDNQEAKLLEVYID
jgi:hypothetical protein